MFYGGMSIKIMPTAKYIIKASKEARTERASNALTRVYNELEDKFVQNKQVTVEEFNEALKKVFEGIHIETVLNKNKKIHGSMGALTNFLNINGFKLSLPFNNVNNKQVLKQENINTVFHELAHLSFEANNPKIISNTHGRVFPNLKKAISFYDKHLYAVKNKEKVEKKLEKFLKNYNDAEKVNVLQFFRSGLASENYAWQQGTNAQIRFDKNISDYESLKQFTFGFQRKIKLLEKHLAKAIKNERETTKFNLDFYGTVNPTLKDRIIQGLAFINGV